MSARLLLGPAVMTLALAAGTATAGAQGAPTKPGATYSAGRAATHLKYGPAPAFLPAGAKAAVVSGDPGKPGPFAIRLRMPSGYRIAPHSHSADETVSVVRGKFQYGMGDRWDASQLKTMKAGGSVDMKAGQNHFVRASGPTEVEIRSTGPLDVNYVNPADDPRNKKAGTPKR